MISPPKQRSTLVDSEAEVQFAEDFLGKHPWFGGPQFSAADIMMVFPLNFAMELTSSTRRNSRISTPGKSGSRRAQLIRPCSPRPDPTGWSAR